MNYKYKYELQILHFLLKRKKKLQADNYYSNNTDNIS